MEGLGRVFNIIPNAADTPWVSLRDCTAVSFVCVGASDTFTLSEARDAAGTGEQQLPVITRRYTNASAAGANAWAKADQPAAATVVTGADDAVAVFSVSANSLSAGYGYLRVVSTGTGTVIAITHDLTQQRSPENLPALAV